MTIYQSPLRDFQFILHELLDVDKTMQSCGRSDLDPETVDQVLAAAGEFASGVIAPLNLRGDREGCRIPEPGKVLTPAGFREAYLQFSENGWNGLACSEEYGGQGFPSVIENAVYEIFGAANMAWSSYPGMSHATYVNIEANGTPELKSVYLPKLASGEWSGTMCLTEPNAGTDVGLLRTRAVPQPNGSHRITGTKIFISGGDHDLTDNIAHLVLARLPDAPPGVKGISLFVVPKLLPSTDGSAGAANGVTCSSIEDKMGIHGNSTCTINFEGASGWLLGEPNKGLAGMFVQMNHMRVLVGVMAVGQMEGAYQKALAYAKDRLQGRAPGAVSTAGGADAIVGHADVRRMLMTQKANVEGMRAVALWVAQISDLQRLHRDPDERRAAAELLSLLTPVVKAMASDLAVESTLLAMQVFGGHGYVRENGVEQHVRDVRIISLYEGTNGVQAMDLLGRKVLADRGERLATFLRLVTDFADKHKADARFVEFTLPLENLVSQVRTVTEELITAAAQDPHAVGAAASPYLRLIGCVAMALMWGRAADIALANSSSSDPVYASKLATARFYFQRLLPQTLALCAEIRAGASTVMDLDASLL